jgi:hypothetical protein
MSDVAGKTPGQIQRWQRGRAAALLRYRARQGRNHAYRELIRDAGADPASALQASTAWDRVPVIDKQWLARAFRLGKSPGPLPLTPRRDPAWATGS